MTDDYTTRVRKYGAAMAAALGEQEQMERFAAHKKAGGMRDHATFEDWRAYLRKSMRSPEDDWTESQWRRAFRDYLEPVGFDPVGMGM